MALKEQSLPQEWVDEIVDFLFLVLEIDEKNKRRQKVYSA